MNYGKDATEKKIKRCLFQKTENCQPLFSWLYQNAASDLLYTGSGRSQHRRWNV